MDVICCVLATTSSSFVGNPSMPSASCLIDFSDSSALNPKAPNTFGYFCIVSKREIAASIDCVITLNAADAILTSPNEIAMSLMLVLAFLDSSPTPLMPCFASSSGFLAPFALSPMPLKPFSASLSGDPEPSALFASLSSSVAATFTSLPSTSMAMLIFPSAKLFHLLFVFEAVDFL